MSGIRKRALVYQNVVDSLRERIRSETWHPGQRIPTVAELSKEFGVGHSSVREALRILGNEQLLRIEQGRGIFVADSPRLPPGLFDHLVMSADVSLAALFEARRLIEPGIAALAAIRASDEDIAIIMGAAQEMAELVRRGEDFAKPDLLIHRHIAVACGNPVLKKLMDPLLELQVESRERTSLIPKVVERSVQYHLLIATAIAEHDASRAESLMRAHLDDNISALRRSTLDAFSIHMERKQVEELQ
ncbi:MAG TPA: FadR/GntR family transcriptional regulator [Ktedonobacteraceae bacterium]|jgi:GntR family transcriptional repressor for pyruvate dehydrogenase complex